MPAYYIGSISASSEDLTHYGVKGMRWGVRRQEKREDNKKAFRLGRQATISDRAKRLAEKRRIKNPTEKNIKLEEYWKKEAENDKNAAVDHYKQLIKKYGKQNVRGIRYNREGMISERVASGPEIGLSIGTTLTSLGLSMLAHVPVTLIVWPKTARGRARQQYDYSKRYIND